MMVAVVTDKEVSRGTRLELSQGTTTGLLQSEKETEIHLTLKLGEVILHTTVSSKDLLAALKGCEII